MAFQFSEQFIEIIDRLDDCQDYVKVAIQATSQVEDDGSHDPINALLQLIAKELKSITFNLDEAFLHLKKGQAND